jgi:hypothetical protein
MTRRPSGAMGVSSPPTDSSVGAHEWELSLLKVHHRTESRALSRVDPGPAGFDFVLPDSGPRAEALWVLARGFKWRRALVKDGW